jgi:hypothetical protein
MSRVCCSVCNRESVKFDPFMYLSLPLVHPTTDKPVETLEGAMEGRGGYQIYLLHVHILIYTFITTD